MTESTTEKKSASKKPAKAKPARKTAAKVAKPRTAKPAAKKPPKPVAPRPEIDDKPLALEALEPRNYKIIPADEATTPVRGEGLSAFHPISLLATWFGMGTASFAPGTAGSLAALLLAWPIQEYLGTQVLLIASFLTFILGAWISDLYMQRKGTGHDPHQIVIDEVAGQWLILIALPHTWQGYVLGFVLFRLFDIWKPWPIRHFDRTVKGGVGVMLDDFLAAIIPGMLIVILTFVLLVSGNTGLLEQIYGALDP